MKVLQTTFRHLLFSTHSGQLKQASFECFANDNKIAMADGVIRLKLSWLHCRPTEVFSIAGHVQYCAIFTLAHGAGAIVAS